MLLGDSVGTKYSPFVVFKMRSSTDTERREENKSRRHGFSESTWKKQIVPAQRETGMLVYTNTKGWWNSELTLDFLKLHFGAREDMAEPILLLLDDFSGHWTNEVVEYANEINVTLMKVPPNATSVCQPADATWNGPLKVIRYIKKLLCETLPSGFKGIATKRMDEPVHVNWRLVEKQYSLSNAAGVVGLVRQFNEMVNADFKSVGQLFQDLNSVRSQVNVNAHEALQTQMLSSQLMLVLVLGVLPRHMWGSSVEFTPDGFTLEKVSDMLNAIFGNKSRSEILALASGKAVNHVNAAPAKPSGSALGKRKGGDGPVRDIHHNLGVMKCHYCGGVHNSMKNIGPHKMVDCHKRAEDKAAGVHRRNIWSRPSRQARKEAYEPTPKMKGNVKGKAKAKVRREIPLAECMGKDVAVDACDAQHGNPPASDDGYMSRPPSNMELPLTPGRGITPFSDEDEPMESVVNAVNADAPGKAQAVDNRSDDDVDMEGHQGEDSKQTIAATTERFAGMMNELEKKVRTLYPFLLDDDLYLTSDSWVLDTA
ncbi:hypothetical protein PR003_g7595 [Phytophthora rubi]|uniref:DDE-1 domain-containing protein n=1 Tax=Phytophthora rubi TaxID=129364 RepID=A0A6A4FM03_9STRA|nr:hypothetical protein PR003_g7595 [Phytophthora rubi]